jgi:hypothetical protein
MRHRVRFGPREVPLAPAGVLAEGAVVERLFARLRERDDGELAALTGVHGAGLVALLGAAEALPWCDGVSYFGSDGNAHGLMLPVSLAPDVPMDWLARALPGAGPRLILPGPHGLRVVPLGEARALDRAQLGGG